MKKDIALILLWLWLLWATCTPLPGYNSYSEMQGRVITPVVTLVVKAWLSLYYFYKGFITDVVGSAILLNVLTLVRGP